MDERGAVKGIVFRKKPEGSHALPARTVFIAAGTQPNTVLQITRAGEFLISLGAKKTYTLVPQTPFAQRSIEILAEVTQKAGGTHGSQIYDDKKTTYRTEVDQALRMQPDAIFCAGYTPDTVVMLKDLYRAGYKGKIIGFAYSLNQKLIDQIGQPEVVEGAYTFAPSPAEGSSTYDRVKKASGLAVPDPYTSQTYDHVSMVLMAMVSPVARTSTPHTTASATTTAREPCHQTCPVHSARRPASTAAAAHTATATIGRTVPTKALPSPSARAPGTPRVQHTASAHRDTATSTPTTTAPRAPCEPTRVAAPAAWRPSTPGRSPRCTSR